VSRPIWLDLPERRERGLDVYGEYSSSEARTILRAAKWRKRDAKGMPGWSVVEIFHKGDWMEICTGDGFGQEVCSRFVRDSNADPIKTLCRFPMWGAMVNDGCFVLIDGATDG
jgi:hypothetical protein